MDLSIAIARLMKHRAWAERERRASPLRGIGKRDYDRRAPKDDFGCGRTTRPTKPNTKSYPKAPAAWRYCWRSPPSKVVYTEPEEERGALSFVRQSGGGLKF